MEDSSTGAVTSRRTFLRSAAGVGAIAVGVGSSAVGTVAGNGISTPWLHRDGNLIKDPSGNTVVLRGMNIADPKRIDVTAQARGKNAVQTVDYATSEEKGWYPRVIRVPVQPIDIGEHPPGTMADPPKPPAFSRRELESYLSNHLDGVVRKCAEENVYCIIDYHRHWSGIDWADGTGINLNPNQELTREVVDFWNTVAPRYSDQSHVIYEVYNEPVKPGIFADPADRNYQRQKWLEYVRIAQPWVDAIRNNADNLVLIGSPSWSQTPEGARVKEFSGEDLAYTYHIYAGHTISQAENWANNNDTGQGTSHVYEEVPLFVTEFGWQDGISSWPLIGTTDDFGKPFMEWLDSAPIHWTAWCFDPVWLPSMVKRSFESGGATNSIGNPYEEEIPTYCENLPCQWEPRRGQNMGVFIKNALYERRNEDVPGSGTGSGENGETEPTGPTDPDGDGEYEDMNGNGETDFDDMVTYFNDMDEPYIRNNVSKYDFNANGGIDFDDLIELFEQSA